MGLAVTSYLVVQAFHIMAVVAAYGLPMSYPLLLPYATMHSLRASAASPRHCCGSTGLCCR